MLVPVEVLGALPATDSPSRGVKAASGPSPLKTPGTPRWNDIVCTRPPRRTTASSRADSALTTLAPTPCRPPEVL
jgi:hypothetical protein